MNLEQFKSTLRSFDKACGFTDEQIDAGQNFFSCGVEQIGPNEFQYMFDGYMPAIVTFGNDDGVIECIEECEEAFNSSNEWIDSVLRRCTEL